MDIEDNTPYVQPNTQYTPEPDLYSGVEQQNAVNVGASITDADVWESLTSLALPDSDWVKSMASMAGYDGMGAGSTPQPGGAKDDGAGSISGLLGRATGWIEKNKKLAEMIAGGVAGALKSRGDNKMLENKYELEQQARGEQRAFNSASITGLRKPSGLLYQGPLKYKSGSNVFNGTGQLNRG